MELISMDHIIILSDIIESSHMMKKTLHLDGYLVTITHELEETVKLLKTSLYEMVILDYHPSLDEHGFGALREIRNIFTAEELPVILMSTANQKEILREAVKLGANDFIIKPVKISEFEKRIERLLVKVSQNEVLDILRSLCMSDSSTLDPRMRRNIQEQNLKSYPFLFRNMKCCAILGMGRNPQFMTKFPYERLEKELVILAQGGYFWNVIWPRQIKRPFQISQTGQNLIIQEKF